MGQAYSQLRINANTGKRHVSSAYACADRTNGNKSLVAWSRVGFSEVLKANHNSSF